MKFSSIKQNGKDKIKNKIEASRFLNCNFIRIYSKNRNN